MLLPVTALRFDREYGVAGAGSGVVRLPSLITYIVLVIDVSVRSG